MNRPAMFVLFAFLLGMAGCGRDLKPAVGNVDELAKLIKEGDDSARASAALALGKMGPDARDAVPSLVLAMRDEYEGVREQSAWALGEMGPDAKAAVPALRIATRDSVDAVRLAAVEALKKIGSPAAPKRGRP